MKKTMPITITLLLVALMFSTQALAGFNPSGSGSRFDGLSYTERNHSSDRAALQRERERRMALQQKQRERQMQQRREQQLALQRERARQMQLRQNGPSTTLHHNHQLNRSHGSLRQPTTQINVHHHYQRSRPAHQPRYYRTDPRRNQVTTTTNVSARDVGFAVGVLGGAAVLHNFLY